MECKKVGFAASIYSTFAGGWPGIGLLLMRLVFGASLLLRANSAPWSNLHASKTMISAFLTDSDFFSFDDRRRPMGHGFARNHWLRSRHVAPSCQDSPTREGVLTTKGLNTGDFLTRASDPEG